MANPNFVPSFSTNEVYVDTNTTICLTDELDAMSQAIENIPEIDPTDYATADHTHTEYAASSHNHDSSYAALSHDHTGYAATDHTHTGYAASTHEHTGYASTDHNHDSSYASTTHTHADKADLVNGKVPISQIPDEVKEIRIVANIAARNATTGLFAGLSVYVVDATGDSTVSSGGAYYLYDGSAWIKTAESESMDVVLQWANVQGKPSTFPPGDHNHDDLYAGLGHGHSDYASSNHNHDGSYASSSHGHDDNYMAKVDPTSSGILAMTGDGNFSGGLAANTFSMGNATLSYDTTDGALKISFLANETEASE